MNELTGPREPVPGEQPHSEEEDYYMDGEFLVFTAAFHSKRGYCCGSGCRHCPYLGEDRVTRTVAETER